MKLPACATILTFILGVSVSRARDHYSEANGTARKFTESVYAPFQERQAAPKSPGKRSGERSEGFKSKVAAFDKPQEQPFVIQRGVARRRGQLGPDHIAPKLPKFGAPATGYHFGDQPEFTAEVTVEDEPIHESRTAPPRSVVDEPMEAQTRPVLPPRSSKPYGEEFQARKFRAAEQKAESTHQARNAQSVRRQDTPAPWIDGRKKDAKRQDTPAPWKPDINKRKRKASKSRSKLKKVPKMRK
jgi:hypothetical protein